MLLRPLLRQSLLLSNGSGFASCTLFNGHRRDGRWGRFTGLDLCNPTAVIPLVTVMRAIGGMHVVTLHELRVGRRDSTLASYYGEQEG
jgi:hypothetical protein